MFWQWIPLTHDAHLCCEHQRHADGEADEVVAHQVAQSAHQLLPGSPEDAARHALDTASTTSQSSACTDVLDLSSRPEVKETSHRKSVKEMSEAEDEQDLANPQQDLSERHQRQR